MVDWNSVGLSLSTDTHHLPMSMLAKWCASDFASPPVNMKYKESVERGI